MAEADDLKGPDFTVVCAQQFAKRKLTDGEEPAIVTQRAENCVCRIGGVVWRPFDIRHVCHDPQMNCSSHSVTK